MADIRGYVTVYPPGALTEAGQRELMPKGAEIYVEDRFGKQIEALIASVRKGAMVAVADAYLLAPAFPRPQKRRRILAERIEAIRERGGDILELRTNSRASRRLPAMMLRAFEQIASSGRARVHNRPGRQIKWNLTREERELAEGLWRSRRYENDMDRAVAIQQRLKKKISRAWMRRMFGSPHRESE